MNRAEIALMLPRAREMARQLGPLLIASDDSDYGLAAAQANYEVILYRPTGIHGKQFPQWCCCRAHRDGIAYYNNLETGSHGWLCCACRGITQTG